MIRTTVNKTSDKKKCVDLVIHKFNTLWNVRKASHVTDFLTLDSFLPQTLEQVLERTFIPLHYNIIIRSVLLHHAFSNH